MAASFSQSETYRSQLRLLLEDLAADLCRFEHVERDGLAPADVHVAREFPLRAPDAFADLRIAPATRPAYFVEVNYGYPEEALVASLRRKYGRPTPDASRVIVVLDADRWADRPRLEATIRAAVAPELAVETWDEAVLRALVLKHLGVRVASLRPESYFEVGRAIELARGRLAFGDDDVPSYANDPLRSELLWRFGMWRLRTLRESFRLSAPEIMAPGSYRNVAVLMADLCAFSSYVRDTKNDEIVRDNLTAFYAKSRYQVLSGGGLLSGFVGDEIIGLFGIPAGGAPAFENALDTARALRSVGNAISYRWQRSIDRQQVAAGVHIGIALGEIQLVSLQPFSRTRIGAVGDAINLAARLTAVAGPGEIVVSNSFHAELPDARQPALVEVPPLECHNVGKLCAWKLPADR